MSEPESSTSQPSFKVGDKVKVCRAIADGEADWWNNNASYFIGDKFTVAKVLDGSVMVEENRSRWPTCILTHANYVPAVGDVVECEIKEWKGKGIVFLGGKSLACNDGEWASEIADAESIELIGHTDVLDGIGDWDTAKPIAKAYFAQPAFTGTYAERQAQWIKFHGITVGSKVKVVREYGNNDGGASCSDWKCGHQDHVLKGEIGEITYITKKYVDVDGWTCAYTALEPVK